MSSGVHSVILCPQVFIQVDDANDNQPSFGINTTRVRIPESSQVGTTLPETYTATDLDIGANGNITYSIQPMTAFTVHRATGTTTVHHAAIARATIIHDPNSTQ